VFNTSRFFSYAYLCPILVVTLLPLVVLYCQFLSIDQDLWQHLWQYVLPEVLQNSFLLALGVGLLSLLWGLSSAYLVTLYQFPGRNFFSWALLLPLSFPLYILAFVYVALFDGIGVVPMMLAKWLGIPVVFPSLRNLYGASWVMSLALYPYVYMLSRNGLDHHAVKTLEVGASLGLRRQQTFRKLTLPLMRPWIFFALSLVVMETLADFGAVTIFNIRTFTVAIYRTWFGLFSLQSAAQMAALLVTFVFLFVFLQQHWDRKKRFYSLGKTSSSAQLIPLTGMARAAATCYLSALFTVSFLIPLIPIVSWSWQNFSSDFDERYLGFITNTLTLSFAAAFMVIFLGWGLAYSRKRNQSPVFNFFIKLATLGYAIPGTVLAVGVFLPFSSLEKIIARELNSLLPSSVSWTLDDRFLTSSVVLLMMAYFIRFLPIGMAGLEAGLEKISCWQMESVKMINLPRRLAFLRIYWPMLSQSFATGFLLTLVEVMKELPLTLMMRPFGKDTLAVRIFELTSEGEWQRAALPSLVLVLTGLISLLLVNWQLNRKGLSS
jgi:iron(III) transport system permease protein